MARRVNKDYVNQYSTVTITQPLAHGKKMVLQYRKAIDGKNWVARYSTDSAYHICPYDGIFRNCKDCEGYPDDGDASFCINKVQVLGAGALSERINECISAGLDVQFRD